ncbi:MAG: tRNA adenosine(34) deaminase TadA [Bacteriovoracaceae bacterium]
MKLALEQAERAYKKGEVPVGAILVAADGKVISSTYNQKEESKNPIGHAELLALQAASGSFDSWRRLGCTLYVTLEPCTMCLGGLVQARVSRLVFGAYDKKAGALSLGYFLQTDSRLNHSFEVVGGVLHYECSKMLSQFFKERRSSHD